MTGRSLRIGIVLLAAALAAPPAFAQETAIVLRADRVLDGRGAVLARPLVIVIEAGKIARIEEGSSRAARAGAISYDLTGLTVLPGLIPFHPPGAPDRLRTQHLETLRTPALILQGTRDPFGSPEDVASYKLSAAIRVHWIPDGDHSLKPRSSSGRTEAQNLEEAISVAGDFCENPNRGH